MHSTGGGNMQVGIIGLLYSGKSTLFSTLLAHQAHTADSKYKMDAERGIIKVPDERLDKLTDLFNKEKRVYATIEFVKVTGIDKESHKGKGLPAQFLANIKTVDIILHIVRSFNNEMYPHPEGSIDPKRDINYINNEFLLSDLAIVENRIEKLDKMIMKTQDEKEKKELEILKRCKDYLEKERPLRELKLEEYEELLLRGYQFLTAKPMLYIINISENEIQNSDKITGQLKHIIPPDCEITSLSAEIEKEISELDTNDAQVFLNDLKISEPATNKLIRLSYQLLDVHSFFTIGEHECRAWTLKKGTTAHRAAGIIHTDMEKGFIRAEVVSYNDLMELGSLQACREKGVLRLEGKEYIVKDGDILNIRFNV
jgi:GTP-binding protein YchF